MEKINDISIRCFVDSGCAASSMSRACYTNQFGSLSSLDGKPEVAILLMGLLVAFTELLTQQLCFRDVPTR